MPKPFQISLQVEEVAFGKVVRILNDTPGVVKIDLHLDGSPKPTSRACR